MLTRQKGQRGLSLIELMVGIAIGMIVVAGASVMMVNQINEHRRLMLETQVQQDLRAAGDLILRELRRAGYRGRVQAGVWSPGTPTVPVAAATQLATIGSTATELRYRYERDNTDGFDADTEQFGFRKEGDQLQFLLGRTGSPRRDNWQPLTDENTVKITAFDIQPQQQAISLEEYCEQPCGAGAVDCPPVQLVRNYTVTLTGQATHDASVVRTLRVSTRVRNDQIVGVCPT